MKQWKEQSENEEEVEKSESRAKTPSRQRKAPGSIQKEEQNEMPKVRSAAELAAEISESIPQRAPDSGKRRSSDYGAAMEAQKEASEQRKGEHLSARAGAELDANPEEVYQGEPTRLKDRLRLGRGAVGIFIHERTESKQFVVSFSHVKCQDRPAKDLRT